MICPPSKGVLLLFCLLTCITFTASAQAGGKHYRSQFTLVSENDNYTFKYKDRYYTNGLAMRFSRALKSGQAGRKKILTAEAGQMIFIPFQQNISFLSMMDRPFTGLLYGRGGLSYFSTNNNVWRWNVLAGVIGEAAGGKEVQRWHHRNFDLPYPHGWETQLKSEFGLNVQATYYQHLIRPSKRGLFSLHARGEVQAGTFFSQLGSGLLLKAGIFERAAQSVFWDAGLNERYSAAPERRHELFLFFEPMLTYQLYNATVQGGMFTRQDDIYTTDIEPYYYSHRFGAMYAQGPVVLQLGFTFKTKEARTMMTNESYGTVGVGVRF